MLIVSGLQRIPLLDGPVIANLGNFDGLHRGHKRIIRKVITRARESGGTAVLVTFEPHPMKVLHPESAPALIQTLKQKREILGHLGVQVLVEIPFNREFAAISAEDFARSFFAYLRPAAVYIGDDFRFGRGRAGDVSLLNSAGGQVGVEVAAFSKLEVGGEAVSSSRIRTLLQGGEMAGAVRLLGRPYIIEGPVREGDSRGRVLGFPTANLAFENELVPAHGVYAVAVDVGEERLLRGVANLGRRPTFGEGEVAVEVHLLSGGRNLYGKRIRCLFFDFLRPEKKFGSAQELQVAIRSDIEGAKSFLAGISLNPRMYR